MILHICGLPTLICEGTGAPRSAQGKDVTMPIELCGAPFVTLSEEFASGIQGDLSLC